jgi:cytochrome oxidase assembly protein ShyY1
MIAELLMSHPVALYAAGAALIVCVIGYGVWQLSRD